MQVEYVGLKPLLLGQGKSYLILVTNSLSIGGLVFNMLKALI
jgi:hypothetical protein